MTRILNTRDAAKVSFASLPKPSGDMFHPVSELAPALSKAEAADLGESLSRDGILVPVIVDEDYKILDGRHRYDMACRAQVVKNAKDKATSDLKEWVEAGAAIRHTGLTDKQKLQLAINANLNRRQMSAGARTEMIKRMAGCFSSEAPQDALDEASAKALGTSKSTVRRVRKKAEAAGKIEPKKPVAERAREAIETMPEASVREQAEEAGVSMSTIKRVRAKKGSKMSNEKIDVPEPPPTPEDPQLPALRKKRDRQVKVVEKARTKLEQEEARLRTFEEEIASVQKQLNKQLRDDDCPTQSRKENAG